MSALALNAAVANPPLADARGRRKRKLRISVTDRCNFRCPYCMPEKPRWEPLSEHLSRAETVDLARLFVDEMGIENIRLTGGEPLLRRDLARMVGELRALDGLQRLSLTSNGVRLAAQAQSLADAGLDDVNVSLDALDPERFARLSRGRYGPGDVIAGIDAARRAGLGVKINTVIIRDHNEDEILPLARWARAQDLELRYIEFMPLDDSQLWNRARVVESREILARLRPHFQIRALPRDGAPAARYALGGGPAIGIIATVSDPFCGDCDRLRLTAAGELFTCLFGRSGTALRPLLDDRPRLRSVIRDAVWRKPAGYASQPGYVERPVRMFQLGG